jgi:hypothetical protein
VFISRIPKYRLRPDGTIEKYDYYRLSENWRDADGKIRKSTVVSSANCRDTQRRAARNWGLCWRR